MRYDQNWVTLCRRCPTILLLSVALFLSACAATQIGVQSGARSKYQAIAVVPRINDKLISVYRPSPFSQPVLTQTKTGWNAEADAGEISRELLNRTGASVSVTSDPNSASAKNAEAIIILQQASLDQFATTYNPGQDMLFGMISIAGAARAGGMAFIRIDDERRYQPRSILEIRESEEGATNYCAVGITPSLIDAATGETIRRGRSLMGVENIPGELSGTGWNELTPKDKSTVLAYCQSALRRVVSQAFVELKVVE